MSPNSLIPVSVLNLDEFSRYFLSVNDVLDAVLGAGDTVYKIDKIFVPMELIFQCK